MKFQFGLISGNQSNFNLIINADWTSEMNAAGIIRQTWLAEIKTESN